ncbi:MAG: acyl-CoA desaturase [Thermoleophilia bacterium]
MTTDAPAARRTAVGTRREHTGNLSRVVTLVGVTAPLVGVAVAMVWLWGGRFGWLDAAVLVGMYIPTGLGITVGYHRLFSHRSFRANRTVTAALAILGSMTLQGPVTQWVTDHRRHHAMSDTPDDPHTPHGHGGGTAGVVRGFVHAHMGWLFRTKGMERGRVYGRDLYDNPLIRRLDRLYFLWVVLSLGIPFGIGWLASGSMDRAVEAMVWGGLVRIFLFQHATWSINSICHMFGRRSYDSADESRNVAWLALPTFGEAWHNNHHAFPGAAIHGMDRRQLDVSGMVIRAMARAGWVWSLKTPTPERRARRRLAPGQGR